MRVSPGSVSGNYLFAPVKYFRDHRPFSFFAITFNVYNSKNTEPIVPKITHHIRDGPVSFLGNFAFASVKYFRDHRPFSFYAKSFNVYNSKNTEPIEPKITHHIRVGPVSFLGNFVFMSIKYFRHHRPFSFFAKTFSCQTRK